LEPLRATFLRLPAQSNGALFSTYVEQVLLPTLAAKEIIILGIPRSYTGRRAARGSNVTNSGYAAA